MSAKGAIDAGRMTSQSLNNQADNLEAQAQESEDKGAYDAMREQMISGQKIGTATAAYGAAGVSATSGSVLDVMQASHQNAELDRLNILHGADVRAINYKNQASMNRFGGQSALFGAYWQALGDLSGGAIKAASFSSAAKPANSGEGAALGSGEADTSAEAGMAGADTGAAAAGVA